MTALANISNISAPSVVNAGEQVNVEISWGNIGDASALMKIFSPTEEITRRVFDAGHSEVRTYSYIQPEGGSNFEILAQSESSPGSNAWVTGDRASVIVAVPGTTPPNGNGNGDGGVVDMIPGGWITVALAGGLFSVATVATIILVSQMQKQKA